MNDKMHKEPLEVRRTNEIIEMPEGAKYLSDCMDTLPKNCLFNKGITGAGGTTIALTDPFRTVICVPYIPLIENKILQSEANFGNLFNYTMFGFYGGVTDLDLNHYLGECPVAKIMVTYDSFERLSALINPEDYNLLIDEYHCLFMDYSFRSPACSLVLRNYKRFKSYTFMTATPLDDNFQLVELRDLRTVTVKWPSLHRVNVVPVRSGKSVIKTTSNHVGKFLDGKIQGNAYIFVNSIKFINKLIKALSLTNESVRVICSVNSKDKLVDGIIRSKTTDAPKKINLITKAAFEGCDIYDPEGKTIIVSDPHIDHSLLDIRIQIPQIIGRLRNSRYNGTVEHIYANTADYDESKMTYEQLREHLSTGMKEGEMIIADHNTERSRISLMELITRRSSIPGMSFIKFDEDGNPSIDENRENISLYRYKLSNAIYSTRATMEAEYSIGEMNVKNWTADFSDFEVIPTDNFTNFKDAYNFVKGIEQKRKCSEILTIEDLQGELECFEKYKFLKSAMNILGSTYIEITAKYHAKNIERKLETIVRTSNPEQDHEKIFNLLKLEGVFKIGKFVSDAVAKKALKRAYEEANYDSKGLKAGDLAKYFIVFERPKRIAGKHARGCDILGDKYQVRVLKSI